MKKINKQILEKNILLLNLNCDTSIIDNIDFKIKKLENTYMITYNKNYLYSKRDNYYFLKNQSFHDFDNKKNVFIITNGLGISIDKTNSNQKIHIFFLDISMFLLFIAIYDIDKFNIQIYINSDSNIFNNSKIHSCRNIFNKKNLLYQINQDNCYKAKTIIENVNNPSYIIDIAYLKDFKEVMSIYTKSINTTLHFSNLWNKGIKKNLKNLLKKDITIKSISKIESPIVVFGASPNLERDIKQLLNLYENPNLYFTIFAMPSAVNMLEKYDIFIDFVFNFDASLFSYFHYPIDNKYKTIYSLINFPKLISKLTNEVVLINLNLGVEKLFLTNDFNKAQFSSSSVRTLLDLLITFNQNIYIAGSGFEINKNQLSHQIMYPLYKYVRKTDTYLNPVLTWESKVSIGYRQKSKIYISEIDILKNYYNKVFHIKELKNQNFKKSKKKIYYNSNNLLIEIKKNYNNLENILSSKEKITEIYKDLYYKQYLESQNLDESKMISKIKDFINL